MTTVSLRLHDRNGQPLSERAYALAERLENGANALAELAERLTNTEWASRMPHDGRRIGVIVHHVASVYPVEINFAQMIAAGTAISGVTGADIDAMNAQHSATFDGVTREETVALLRTNSAIAAEAIRAMSDDDLDRAVPISLYADAPLTCQFMLEDHAVRHSYHHYLKIRRALNK